MHVDLIDTAWASGIIEGEGTIVHHDIKNRKASKRCSITVSMTDEDVIRKLHKVLDEGYVGGPYKGVNKPFWTWSVQNQKGCFNTLIRIMPHLGERRLQKASEMFKYLESKIDKWI